MKKYFYTFLFGFAALCVFLNLAGNKFFMFPEAEYLENSFQQKVTFKTESGAEIHGAYIPPADYMDTILFFHGNAGNITYFEDFAKLYTRHGYGILLFDYRGFGRSEGRISEANIYEDSRAALQYLIKEKKTAPHNIILWGYSLGNAPAVQTALTYSTLPFKAVILQSPFTSVPRMGGVVVTGKYKPEALFQKLMTGFLYVVFFNKRYDNLSKIPRLKAPILIGYSKEDSLIPWQMSEALAAAAPEGTKTFLSPRGKHTEHAWFEDEALAFLRAL